jgi:hypothetical protein
LNVSNRVRRPLSIDLSIVVPQRGTKLEASAKLEAFYVARRPGAPASGPASRFSLQPSLSTSLSIEASAKLEAFVF